MEEFLLSGILIGLSAGFAPGPMMALVISETVKHGLKEGAKVAIAPFLTDLPIVIIVFAILSRFSNIDGFLGVISVLGALYILYLAYESITIKPITIDIQNVKAQSLKKGVITNFLNPAPYLFYFTVGGAILLRATKINYLYGVLFVAVFLLMLVVSKISIALIVEKSRTFLKSKVYLYINRLLGVLLLYFAVHLLIDAAKLFHFYK